MRPNRLKHAKVMFMSFPFEVIAESDLLHLTFLQEGFVRVIGVDCHITFLVGTTLCGVQIVANPTLETDYLRRSVNDYVMQLTRRSAEIRSITFGGPLLRITLYPLDTCKKLTAMRLQLQKFKEELERERQLNIQPILLLDRQHPELWLPCHPEVDRSRARINASVAQGALNRLLAPSYRMNHQLP